MILFVCASCLSLDGDSAGEYTCLVPLCTGITHGRTLIRLSVNETPKLSLNKRREFKYHADLVDSSLSAVLVCPSVQIAAVGVTSQNVFCPPSVFGDRAVGRKETPTVVCLSSFLVLDLPRAVCVRVHQAQISSTGSLLHHCRLLRLRTISCDAYFFLFITFHINSTHCP